MNLSYKTFVLSFLLASFESAIPTSAHSIRGQDIKPKEDMNTGLRANTHRKLPAGGVPNGKPFQAIEDELNGLRGGLSDLQDDLDSGLAAVRAEIDGLATSILANTASIEALEASYEVLRAELNTLLDADLITRVDALKIELAAAVDEYRSNYAEYTANVAGIEAEIATLNGNVSTILTTIADLDVNAIQIELAKVAENQHAISVLQQSKMALESSILGLEDWVTSLQNLLAGTCTYTSPVKELTTSGGIIDFFFSNTSPAIGGLVNVDVWVRGDLGYSAEYYIVRGEDNEYIGKHTGENNECSPFYSKDEYEVARDEFNSWRDNDMVDIRLDASNGFYLQTTVNTFCTYNDAYVRITYQGFCVD